MNRMEPINDILILGAGTAGWMSAAYLSAATHNHDVRLRVVSSRRIGTIGVGEATTPALTAFIRAIELNENILIDEAYSTYKLGIRFERWRGTGHVFTHPFGLCGGHIDGLDLAHFLTRRHAPDVDNSGGYEAFSLQRTAIDGSRAPHGDVGPSPMTQTGAYAFHIDADRFASVLERHCLARGVVHTDAQVTGVEPDGAGGVAAVTLDTGERVAADLFVDCTGFRGLLIEEALKDPWVDYSDRLFVDRALAGPTSASRDPAPVTLAVAHGAGWGWTIPLTHRTGRGHVYSSAHQSDADAAADFARTGVDPADTRPLRLRIGKRTRAWRGNVLAVGLSGAFLEPLESTGLYLTQRALELFVAHLPDRAMSPALARAFNAEFDAVVEEARDIVQLHYVLADRPEPFWRDAIAAPRSTALDDLIALYDEMGLVSPHRRSFFKEPSIHFIMRGNGRVPRRAHPQAARADPAAIHKVFAAIREQNRAVVASLPSHGAYLRSVIATGVTTPP